MYTCYYCGKIITSESELHGHRNKCHGVVINFGSNKTNSDQDKIDSHKSGTQNSAINVYHGLLRALSQNPNLKMFH